jgi:hypothetical protein
MKYVLAGIAICGLAATAHADRADQLFKKGKKLLAEKKYPEACTAFEESDRLDPGIGAKLNVARCYEEWGKLATAWRWYSDAEHMAASSHDDRAQKIQERIDELDPGVPRLTVSLPAGAITDHLVVRLDGVELELAALGAERRVDPGPHQLDTILSGAKQTKMVPLERGGSAEITLQVPVRSRRTHVSAGVTQTEQDDDPGRTRRLVGLGTGGAGVATVGIAIIVTLRARGDYHHALTAHCSGATNLCDDIGLTATHSARHRANISTAFTLVGLAAIGGGAYLYLTARHDEQVASTDRQGHPDREARRGHERRQDHALYVTPVLGGDGAGVVLGGAF